MLPKPNRLNRTDFETAFKKGRRLRSKTFGLIIFFQKNSEKPDQFGIAVSKKAYRTAVARNKIKRQIRNVLNCHILKSLPKGFQTIVTAFPVEKKRNYQEIKEELIELFQKIRI